MAKAKPIVHYQITNDADLAKKVQEEINIFLQKLPSLLTFSVTEKKSFRDAQGNLHKGDFAVLEVYSKTKRSIKTLFDEYALGTIPPSYNASLDITGQMVAAKIAEVISGTQVVPPQTPAAPAAPSIGLSLQTLNQHGLRLVRATALASNGSNALFFIDRFGVSHGFLNPDYPTLIAAGLAVDTLPLADINNPGTLPNTSGANYDTVTMLQRIKQDYTDKLTEENANALAAGQQIPNPTISTSPAAQPVAPAAAAAGFPDNIFIQNSPYQAKNNPTIYVYYNQQLHAVTSARAFAGYFNQTYKVGMDLNQIRAILPMPDLTAYTVPANFFTGTQIV